MGIWRSWLSNQMHYAPGARRIPPLYNNNAVTCQIVTAFYSGKILLFLSMIRS